LTCGKYRITFAALREVQTDSETCFKLASWNYGQNLGGFAPLIDVATVESVRAFPRPQTARRIDLYLGRAISSLGGKLLGSINITDPRLKVASWSPDDKDAIAIAEHLTARGAFEEAAIGERRLGVQAHILYEEMHEERTATVQVFVAMWFDASVRDLFEHGVSQAVNGAGYEPIRVDRLEHDQKIDDKIIAEIRRSAFVIADFTGHRGGVYYEAGFAHGLGKRVIFTCRKDAIKDLHFDVRQYNTIDWVTPAEVIAPLQNRILALFGAGPKGSTGPI
jgi:hypothetical protein